MLLFVPHIYFLFKICETINNLIETKKFFNDKVTLNFKLNYRLIEAHYAILYKQPKYKKYIILFFIGFKIKILFNIILLKYIGYIYCFGVLYAQLKLYIHILNTWYILNDALTFSLDFIYVNLSIKSTYARYMISAYIVFFMTLGEFIVLLVNGLK